LRVDATNETDIFEVCGRGELQMAILIETMRREGYEFMVSKPRVITKEENGNKLEPVESVFLDLEEDHVGTVTEKLSKRKGRMTNLQNNGFGRTILEFKVPSRGMIGFRSQFLTDTKGSGILNSLFDSYAPWFGDIPQRNSGVIIADRAGKVTPYASLAMADRGELFVDVAVEVYKGMIVGERNKVGDLDVNIVREKKLTNVRSANKDNTVVLRPCKKMSLDQCIEFISDDELIEVTPSNLRLRKMELDINKRISQNKKNKEI
jgi:GTP-binding protein